MKKALSVFLALLVVCVSIPVCSAQTKQEPRIIETFYPTRDVVVADIVLTEAPYSADLSGKEDCSRILQSAIDDLYSNGGGTVFLRIAGVRPSNMP